MTAGLDAKGEGRTGRWVSVGARPPQDLALSARRRTEADAAAEEAVRAGRIRRYYRGSLARLLRFLIEPGARVLDVGCGTGDLLAALEPARGLGIDHSPRAIELARARHPRLEFRLADAAELAIEPAEPFDAIVLANVVGELVDVQRTLARVREACDARTRVVVTYPNYLWSPAVALAEKAGLKPRGEPQSWLTLRQLAGLCELEGLEVVTWGRNLLLPLPLPGLEALANRLIGPLPLVNALCVNEFIVARLARGPRQEHSVSVVVPCKDEVGNVAETIRSVPKMGLGTELIFVDGRSTDGTVDEIRRCAGLNPDLDAVRVLVQDGKGKADAVRKGFDAATGDILMILDADNTVRGEELPRFYDALVSGSGELVSGSRLVFPMEDQAMRHLNLLANHFFGAVFSWLVGQPLTDTLCGTKVLFRRDWPKIRDSRAHFGEDPFGDFDLLFGAARKSLKIREIPIRYRARAYGDVKIERFRNGLELLRMAALGFRRLKQI